MSATGLSKPVVAAFDFDGTLTRRDTLFPFLLYVVGWPTFVWKFLLSLGLLTAYALKLMRNDIAKERLLTRFLGGMDSALLQRKGVEFAEQKIQHLLRADAMWRLHWHVQQGHRCVVVSASLELYLQHWAGMMGFSDALGTRLQTQADGRVTGRLEGANCFGAEKMRRLDELLGDRSEYVLYAYGDSRGDKELLSGADHAFYRKFHNS